MSAFTTTISDSDRVGLTVAPPPVYQRDGTLCDPVPMTDARVSARAMKEANLVYIDEELDAYDHPGSLRHYRMMVRCMPWRSDLNVIMRAAQHMGLVGEYQVTYDERTGLNAELERGFWDVQYTIAREEYLRDADLRAATDIYIPFAMRRRIWTELFSALGHRVKFGTSVLNVRRKR